MPNDSRPGFDSPVWRNDLDARRLRSLIAHDWDHHIRQLRQSLAHHGEVAVARLNDQGLLEQVVRLIQSRRLHVVRSSKGSGLQFVTNRSVIAPPTRGARITPERPPVLEPTLVAALTAVVQEPLRYSLIVALAYHPTRALFAGKTLTTRFKWQNEVTGPETRRSGEMKPSDPRFSELRRREMRVGDYRLEFQNAMIGMTSIKRPRS